MSRALAALLALVLTLGAAGPADARSKAPQTAAEKRLERLKKKRDALLSKAQNREALPLCQRVVELTIEVYGEAHLETVLALDREANTAALLGDGMRALELRERLLELKERMYGPESLEVAMQLELLANTHWRRRNFTAAVPLAERALALAAKLQGADSDGYAYKLMNYGSMLAGMYSYTAAEQAFRRSIAILEARHGAESHQLFNPLLQLMFLEVYRQQPKRALPTADRVMELARKLPDPTGSMRGGMLWIVGHFYGLAGDEPRRDALWAEVEAIYRDQLDTSLKAHGGEHPMTLMNLRLLAGVLQQRGELDEARELHLRAMRAEERAHGKDSLRAVTSLYSLYAIEREQGRLGASLKILERLAVALRKSEGRTPRTPYTLMADVLHEMGEFGREEKALLRLMDAWRRDLGSDDAPLMAQFLTRLAFARAAGGKARRGLKDLARALDLQEQVTRHVLPTGTEADNRAYLAQITHHLDMALSMHLGLLPDSRQAAELALTQVLREKGRLLDATVDTYALIRERVDAPVRKLLDALKRAQTKLAQLAIAGPQAGEAKRYAKELGELEREVRGLERQLRDASDVFKAARPDVDIRAVQKALPQTHALVEWVVYRRQDPKAYQEEGERRYAAYVLTDKALQWADLGPAQPIDEAVERFRAGLSAARSPKVKARAQGLYTQLMAPVEPLLGGRTEVLLSPDGALNLLPFGALADGSGRWLVERFTFTYLTSGRDLLRLSVRPQPRDKPLILADPAFDGSGKPAAPAKEEAAPKTRGALSRGLSGAQWTRLPGTAKEARSIAEPLAQALGEARVLAGEAATEAALKAAKAPSIVHLATHGFFLPPEADDLFGSAAVAQTLTAQLGQLPTKENPLLRSGLVLAGANVLQSGEDDGVLTALEAASLDLWGTRLVVLSACETGVGSVSEGQGVYGLRRAMVMAGAESQVMSLWKVDDDATEALMTGYYKRLARGLGRSQALRSAQLRVLGQPETAHPYYWAGFVPAGAWTPLK